MADFFEQQDRAKKSTGWLLLLMAGAIIVITLVIGGVVSFFFQTKGEFDEREALLESGQASIVDKIPFSPSTFGITFVVVSGVVLLSGLGKTMQLAKGGSVVAEMVGGRLVSAHAADPNQQKLLNIVEEMSIASGVPMPDVYLLEDRSINAFAAGHTIDDAAIGVTRGAIDLLSRDELQGVIAHEFSHILNGDMRLNTRLIALVFGLLVIAIIGRFAMRVGFYSGGGSSRDRGGVNPILLLGLACMILGYIGVLFGNIIKAAISRQREYLADASAVQFTRNPDGIAGALMKIGSVGSAIRHPEAEEVSHMFFGQGVRAGLTNIFATHPPLVKRIKAIDPSFDGNFEQAAAALKRRQQQVAASQPPPPPRLTPPPIPTAASLVAAVGAPTTHHLNEARRFYQQVPDNIRDALHEVIGAKAVVSGLLLSHDDQVRQQQMTMLDEQHPVLAREVRQLSSGIQSIPAGQRLPVVELAMPALRHLAPQQLEHFEGIVEALTAADQQLDLFEFALARLLKRHLLGGHGKGHRPVVKIRQLAPVRNEVALILSALAHLSADNGPQAVQGAFASGVAALNDRQPMTLRPWEACDLGAIDQALDKLATASPTVKKNLLYACGQTVTHDREVNVEEGELIRAIADAMDCPVPPMVQVG